MVDWISNFITNTFEGLFLEGFVIFGLIGLAMLLIGAFTVAASSIRLFQPKVDGTVLGGIKVAGAGNKAKYYPIYEYASADGSIQQTHAPNSGSHTFRYWTGQKVRLVISEGTAMSAKGTGIDAGDRTGIKVGLLFMVWSLAFIYGAVDTFAATSLGVLSIIGIAASVILRRVLLPVFGKWNGKTGAKGAGRLEKLHFDVEDIRPIEELAKSQFGKQPT